MIAGLHLCPTASNPFNLPRAPHYRRTSLIPILCHRAQPFSSSEAGISPDREVFFRAPLRIVYLGGVKRAISSLSPSIKSDESCKWSINNENGLINHLRMV